MYMCVYTHTHTHTHILDVCVYVVRSSTRVEGGVLDAMWLIVVEMSSVEMSSVLNVPPSSHVAPLTSSAQKQEDTHIEERTRT
jgi:hypothetical protein